MSIFSVLYSEHPSTSYPALLQQSPLLIMEATEIETKPILETSAMDHGGEALEEATATQEAEPKVQTKENKKIRQKVGRADQM